ncbi:OLC1v1001975C1 [Oldenlandia corymbosa var. corymbosa]|uniref:Hexosyltransferase n=1 Tax=Oldenlandia corymbosa var. corymbosa TaxID=529605 RepID=A0AAV1D6J3_OLDCO|nr:OLC1v1001975C1 [Oldenlandia corymbosa var. corymbosa]
MLEIIKFANLLTISIMIILFFFPALQSSPPAEAIRSSASVIPETSSFFFRKAAEFKNVKDEICNPSFVHVAMTLDVQFLRGTIASVHSILLNSVCPENIFFHFISSDTENDLISLIKGVFPSIKLKGHYFNPEIVQKRISSTVRQALEQPLNYARNYLAHLIGEPGVERVIYLDSDVVLVDDVSKLWEINLQSAILGSPEYCQANFTKYFTHKFWSQEKFFKAFSGRKPCYFNTGVMVIDLVTWRKNGCTKKIERWMEIQKDYRIYDLGSLPPFLLAFAGKIAPIDHRWNQHGLGGDNLRGNCRQLHPGPVSLLHWSGKGKPWLRLDSGNPCPLDLIWSHYDLYGSSL